MLPLSRCVLGSCSLLTRHFCIHVISEAFRSYFPVTSHCI
ncbi:hypothetical protein E2C01_000335 [Portunus trituberculatus]|uniref:Uncharacterized protein n=1 Tax=Portunus trituberculatus TaxID=210409 RepID=A0A5B7CEV8_PORTR|nr:hypothetical protein [Portunus trituberculatus]